MPEGRPEVHRSGFTSLNPDHIETETEVGHRAPRDEPGGGPVPEDNRPGHHPGHDQDKPDLDDFAARFGTAEHGAEDSGETAGDDGGGRREVDDRQPAGDEGVPAVEDMPRTETPEVDRAASDSGPGVRSRTAGGPNAGRAVIEVATGAVGVAGKVAGPVFTVLRGAAGRVLGGDQGGAETAPLSPDERIARLEARVAEMERRLGESR